MNPMQKAAELDLLASKSIVPYVVIMLSLVVLALFVRFSPLPQIEDPENEVGNTCKESRTNIFCFPHLWIGIATLFLYVGVEVIAIDTIIGYGKSLDMNMDVAKVFPTYSMIAMIVGYVIGIICIPKYISQERALACCASLAIILGIGVAILPPELSIWSLTLLSLANSLMWPAIFPLAIFGLGQHTKTGSALMIMAIAGGALLPMLYGSLTSSLGHQGAYWMILPCYLFILYFAIAGHKVGIQALYTKK